MVNTFGGHIKEAAVLGSKNGLKVFIFSSFEILVWRCLLENRLNGSEFGVKKKLEIIETITLIFILIAPFLLFSNGKDYYCNMFLYSWFNVTLIFPVSYLYLLPNFRKKFLSYILRGNVDDGIQWKCKILLASLQKYINCIFPNDVT